MFGVIKNQRNLAQIVNTGRWFIAICSGMLVTNLGISLVDKSNFFNLPLALAFTFGLGIPAMFVWQRFPRSFDALWLFVVFCVCVALWRLCFVALNSATAAWHMWLCFVPCVFLSICGLLFVIKPSYFWWILISVVTMVFLGLYELFS